MRRCLPGRAEFRAGARILLESVAFTLACGGALWALTETGTFPAIHETIGTACVIASVRLTRAQNILCWPIAIVATIALGMAFLHYGLPGQALFQFACFLPTQVLGWWRWATMSGGDRDRVSTLPWITRLACLAALPLLTLVLAATLGDPAHRLISCWDANVAAASLIAVWLLTHKKIETWLFWIGPMHFSGMILYVWTGAWLLAVLYIFCLVNAVLALCDWHRELPHAETASTPNA
jgi:nicotinamide riboside transporter PnuC